MSPSQRKCPACFGVFLQYPGVSTIIFRLLLPLLQFNALVHIKFLVSETFSRTQEGVPNDLAE